LAERTDQGFRVQAFNSKYKEQEAIYRLYLGAFKIVKAPVERFARRATSSK
jgi:hypothetical protein